MVFYVEREKNVMNNRVWKFVQHIAMNKKKELIDNFCFVIYV